MASIASFLPKPKHSSAAKKNVSSSSEVIPEVPIPLHNNQPPYGSRQNWAPRTLADFGDGGAFPEIHVAQYPLNLGRKESGKSKSSKTVALRVDESGNIQYGAIARVGVADNQIVQHSLASLKPLDVADVFEKPSVESAQETAERTRLALEKIVSGKVKTAKTTSITSAATSQAATYIKYTPQQPEMGIERRVIKMVEAPVDPLEPPRFKLKKVQQGPGSPPAPVLHAPPAKITAEEQKAWKIPSVVSNWKNPKGFVIPLDKRLAADGRDLQEVKINDNFAKLAEALYIADRHAREEVAARAKIQKKLAEKEKESKEAHLRELAQRAREDRAQVETTSREFSVAPVPRDHSPSISRPSHIASPRREADNYDEDYWERERIRKEREREIKRQVRLANTGKSKQDRDVSEKIALGIARPASELRGEALYDQRLFNRTQGISSGLADDEAYNLYDKPLFHNVDAIYKPRNLTGNSTELDVDTVLKTNRFVPDRGFKGTEEAIAEREGPVKFKRSRESDSADVGQFLEDATSLKPAKKQQYGLQHEQREL